MKQLELELNKRLLIVEYGSKKEAIANSIVYSDPNCHLIKIDEIKVKFICKGPDLTDDIAKVFVELHESTYYKDYLNNNSFFTLPSKSFISAIESKGYHWGENPVKFNDDEADFEKRHKNRIDWERAEFRTFNHEKCIIFEIL